MKLQIGFTMNWASFWSRQVVRIAGGSWSHCLVLWTVTAEELKMLVQKGIVPAASTSRMIQDPDGMFRFYFESHWHKDQYTGKSGWRGPYPFLRLGAWVSENPGKHKLEIKDVPTFSTDRLERALKKCFDMVGVWRYAKKQLVFNWRGFRLKVGVPIWLRLKQRVTCSEGAVKIVAIANPPYAVEVLLLGLVVFDEYAPSSKRWGGVYEGMPT